MITLLDTHLRTRLYFAFQTPSSGCDCNWSYTRDFGDKGTVTLGLTKCKDGKRDKKCPQKMEHWKGGVLQASIDIPKKARLVNEFLEQQGLL